MNLVHFSLKQKSKPLFCRGQADTIVKAGIEI